MRWIFGCSRGEDDDRNAAHTKAGPAETTAGHLDNDRHQDGIKNVQPKAALMWSARVPQAIAGLLLIVAMVLGGGPKGGGDAVVHAVALLALALAMLRWQFAPLGGLQRTVFWVLIAAVGVALLQLIPLPGEVFARLPQRAQVLSELRSAGLDPHWLPMTLDRWGTVRALLALLSFLAMWMLCTTLSLDARIQLLKLAVAVAVPMALLGFAQASIKRDTTGATALFANRNHFATLMAMLLPFAFAAARQARAQRNLGGGIAWHAAAVAMLLAAALSFSRVGSLLAFFSAAVALAILGGSNGRGFAASRNALIAVAIAALAVGYFASERLIARFHSDLAVDLRWQYFVNGWSVLKSYLPWGSGLGSFPFVYARFEPLQSLGEFTYANYAHNELLQNGMEAGLPVLALMAIFFGVVAIAAIGALAHRSTAGDWHSAAAIAAVVPLLHSLVDYPLRTLACSILLALVVSVLVGRGSTTPSGSARGPQSQ